LRDSDLIRWLCPSDPALLEFKLGGFHFLPVFLFQFLCVHPHLK
jgi:hypothetical protein